ncbi:zinc-ribbon domain-containing protein [Armatimonas sp.]|uniref:zinc-ribbon domain-containing protein n=1 Tax=Armatimonas sp. TaxID=1872638 RepID=UPI00286D4992|nr:zinc-ribbon domain-containing protein [Armatimonas sp.]
MSEVVETPSVEKPIFCANCGERNPRTNKFCGSCGTVLVTPPTHNTPPIGEYSPVVEAAPSPSPPAPSSPVAPASREEGKPVVHPSVTIPDDPIARERELQRLLTRANVERARALIRDARKTLEQAMVLAPHVSPTAAAPVYEQLGDLLAAEERLEQAKEHYEKALELSGGKRLSAEKKLGEVTVRISDHAAMERLGGVLAPSEDLLNVLRTAQSGKRHAGLTMVFSLVPGLGQFYCGQIVKGGILLSIFVVATSIVLLLPDRDALFEHLAGAFSMGRMKLTQPAPGTPTVIFAVIAFAAWVYSIADAPFSANRTEALDTSPNLVPAPMGSRADWEP